MIDTQEKGTVQYEIGNMLHFAFVLTFLFLAEKGKKKTGVLF